MVKKARETAAQRREREAKELAEKEQAFEQNKKALWAELWAKALELALVRNQNHNFSVWDNNSWFFDEFSVDPLKKEVALEGFLFTEDTLSYHKANLAANKLELGCSLLDDYLAELERERLAREAKEKLVKEALSKLTAEEKEALGVENLGC